MLSGLSLISSCTFNPNKNTPATLNYDDIEPAVVEVSKVVVTDQYKPPLKLPNIEHKMINPPYRAAFNMMNSAFVAGGTSNVLHLNIIEASIEAENTYDTVSNFKFWQDQSAKHYSAELLVEADLQSLEPPYNNLGSGHVSLTRELVIADTTSVLKREEALNKMVEALISDLRQGLSETLGQKLLILRP